MMGEMGKINVECPRGCGRDVWVPIESTTHEDGEIVVHLADEALIAAFRRHRCRTPNRRRPHNRRDTSGPAVRDDPIPGPY